MLRFFWERCKAQIDVAVTLGIVWLIAHAGLPSAMGVAGVVTLSVGCVAILKKIQPKSLFHLRSLNLYLAERWNGEADQSRRVAFG